MKRTAMLAAAVVLINGIAYAQQEPGVNFTHLKVFEPYIGTWVKHGTLEEDMPFGKKGDIGTSTLTWSWAYNKNAVDWRWEFDYAGQRSGTKGTIAWDPSNGKLVGAGVASDGVLIRVTDRSLDPLTSVVEFTEPAGTKRSHVETFTLSGDTMTLKITDRKGGTTSEDSPEYIFQRGKLNQQEPGPNFEHLKPLRWMIGEWINVGELPKDVPGVGKKGDPIQAVINYRWQANRNALVFNFHTVTAGVKRQASFGVISWDVEKKTLVTCAFDADGGCGRGTMKIAANTQTIVGRKVAPNGEVIEETATIEKIGQDSWRFTAEDGETASFERTK